MAKQALKHDAAPISVPQDMDDLETALRELGELQRKRANLEAGQTDAIDKVKATYASQAKPIDKEIKLLSKNIATFSAANRKAMTDNGKTKTFNLSAGKISWRITPLKVSVRKAEEVLATLRDLRLSKFIRTKFEIDKEAMLKDVEAAQEIVGVTITNKEVVSITPFYSNIEEIV